MAADIGVKVSIDGYQKFKTEIQDITQSQKTLKSEMAAVSSAWDKNTSAEKKNAEHKRILNQQISEQEKKVKALQDVVNKTSAKYGENSREVNSWKEKLNSATAELNKMQTELKNIPNGLQTFGTSMKNAGDHLKKFGEAFAPISAVAAAGIGASVKLAADFEGQMSKVQAISGTSAEDMSRLTDKAREMGATTKFSATEAGQAMEYMAMAGWKADDMVSGISGIMNLAAASGEDLAMTSDIVTDALTAFGMSAEDSGHFADVLAAASSNANTNVAMLGESFKYAAPVAGAMGYSAEDVSIALGLMANSGIKASQAGTSLRTALSNMANPTKEMVGVMSDLGLSLTDEEGNMKSLKTVMDDLRSAFSVTTEEQMALNYAMEQDPELMGHLMDGWDSMTDAQKKYQTELSVGTGILESLTKEELKKTAADKLGIELTKDRILTTEEYNNLAQILGQDTLNGLSQSEQIAAASTLFGKNAMAGMLAILNAADEDYQKLTEAIYGSDGAAKTMADTMQDNLNGQLTVLKSGLEEAAISIGNALLPAIKGMAEGVQNAVTWFNSLDEGTKTVVAGVGVFVAAIAPVAVVLGTVISSVGTVVTAIGAAVPVIAGIATAFGTAAAAAFPFIAIGAAVVAAGVAIYNNWDVIKEKAQELATAVGEKFDEIKTAAQEKWQAANEAVSNAMESVKTKVSEGMAVAKEVAAGYLQQLVEEYEKSGGGMSGAIEAAMTTAKQIFDDAYAYINEITGGKFGEIVNTIKTNLENLKAEFTEKFDNVKQIVSDAVEFLKGIFDFEWKLPDIKLPHFKVSGQFSLDPPSFPTFGVEWYAKAMGSGVILNSPTIFGMSGGNLLGAGEAGAEVVVGAGSLSRMIQNAVSNTYNSGGNTINVYGAPGQDVHELAEAIADIINGDIQSKGAVWA